MDMLKKIVMFKIVLFNIKYLVSKVIVLKG